jgi:hypothetical protein
MSARKLKESSMLDKNDENGAFPVKTGKKGRTGIDRCDPVSLE